MEISQAIAKLKSWPDFTDNVGMLLIRNGVVRNWLRLGRHKLKALDGCIDQAQIDEIRREYIGKEGIYGIVI